MKCGIIDAFEVNYMESHRDSIAYINVSHLLENIQYIYKTVKKPIMAIVKANAYGHGIIDISKKIEPLDMIEMFGVATLEEALLLRKAGIKKQILVLGVTKLTDLDLAIKFDIRITVYSENFVCELLKYQWEGNLYLHLKLDTGMNRIGIKSKDYFIKALKLLENHPNIVVEGVFTHYGAADETNDSYKQQLKAFIEVADKLNIKYKHAANSAGALYHDESELSLTNLVRCGIAMYGIEPNGVVESPLKQVMSLYSKVVMVKKIKKGEKVGYGFTYKANKDQYIATVPLGYGDGFIRNNQGRKVYINGKYYPIIGRICMDQLMVEVDETIMEDADVEIFGEHIHLNNMAKELNTIAYEIICLISRRIPRVYVDKK